ncbi:RNB domain-containing ribonuclease [Escherichia coli]
MRKRSNWHCSGSTTSRYEAITSFRSVLAELGWSCRVVTSQLAHYAELLESVADRPDAEMLQTMLLRSMKQAIYDPENRGHFGLALQSYAVTSLRRSSLTGSPPPAPRLSSAGERAGNIRATPLKPAATIIRWKRCCNWVSTVRWRNVVPTKQRAMSRLAEV